MQTRSVLFVTVAAFCVGVLIAASTVLGPGRLISLLIPYVTCDIADEVCRARMRADARLRLRFGDDENALAIYRDLSRAGDLTAGFQIGWHHDEAYRALVGRALAAATILAEATQYAYSDAPSGANFEAAVDRHAAPQTKQEQRDGARALAYLWYRWAAQRGFGPAMNNLGTMYQAGITGKIDKAAARRWYIAAYDAGTPAAALNLAVLRRLGYDDPALDCKEQGGAWLPLVVLPPKQYLMADVMEHTRFRGLRSDGGVIGVIRNQMKPIPTSTPTDEAALKDGLEIVGAVARTISGSSSDNPPLYDDETEADRTSVPTFAVAQARSAARTKQRGDCAGIAVEPRALRAEAVAVRSLPGPDRQEGATP